jgi:hypothetical protein
MAPTPLLWFLMLKYLPFSLTELRLDPRSKVLMLREPDTTHREELAIPLNSMI